MIAVLFVGMFVSSIQGSKGYDLPEFLNAAVNKLLESANHAETILVPIGFTLTESTESNTKQFFHDKLKTKLKLKYADLLNASKGLELRVESPQFFLPHFKAQVILLMEVEEDRLSLTAVANRPPSRRYSGQYRFRVEQTKVETLWRNVIAVEKSDRRDVDVVFSASWISSSLDKATVHLGNGNIIALDKLKMANDHKGQAIVWMDILDNLKGVIRADFDLRVDNVYLNAEIVNGTWEGSMLMVKLSKLETSFMLNFAGSPGFQIVGEVVHNKLIVYLYTKGKYKLELSYDKKKLPNVIYDIALEYDDRPILTGVIMVNNLVDVKMNVKSDRLIMSHYTQMLSGFRLKCQDWRTCGLPPAQYNNMEDPFLIDINFRNNPRSLDMTFHTDHVWNFKSLWTTGKEHETNRQSCEISLYQGNKQVFYLKGRRFSFNEDSKFPVVEYNLVAQFDYCRKNYNYYLEYETSKFEKRLSTGIIENNLKYGVEIVLIPGAMHFHLIARLGRRGECHGQISFAQLSEEAALLRCNGVTNFVGHFKRLSRGGVAVDIEGDSDLFQFGGRRRPGNEVSLSLHIIPVSGGHSVILDYKRGPLTRNIITEATGVNYSNLTEHISVSLDVKPNYDYAMTSALELLGDGDDGNTNTSLYQHYFTADGIFTSQSGNVGWLSKYNSSYLGTGNLKVEVDRKLVSNLEIEHTPDDSEPNRVSVRSGTNAANEMLLTVNVDVSDALKLNWNGVFTENASYIVNYSVNFPKQSTLLCSNQHNGPETSTAPDSYCEFFSVAHVKQKLFQLPCFHHVQEELNIKIISGINGTVSLVKTVDHSKTVDLSLSTTFSRAQEQFLGKLQVKEPLAKCSDNHCLEIVFDNYIVSGVWSELLKLI